MTTTPYVYTAEQQSVIDQAIRELEENLVDPQWRSYMTAERDGSICQRGNEFFAIFGTIAFKLIHETILDDEMDSRVEFVPVLVNGQCIAQFPEEGAPGVLHLMRFTRRRGKEIEHPKWTENYMQCRWLNTSELNQSNEEILEHIVEEIEDGQTPLTGGGCPGWA